MKKLVVLLNRLEHKYINTTKRSSHVSNVDGVSTLIWVEGLIQDLCVFSRRPSYGTYEISHIRNPQTMLVSISDNIRTCKTRDVRVLV